MSDLLKSMKDVRHLGKEDIDSMDLDSIQYTNIPKNSSCVKVVFISLDNMSRGIRPRGVPEDAYRIRLGIDTSIAHLVSSFRQKCQNGCISLDFGGISSDMTLTLPQEYTTASRRRIPEYFDLFMYAQGMHGLYLGHHSYRHCFHFSSQE